MHYDQKVFVIQFPIVKLFIYHLTSTLRVSRRVAERFRESFPEGGGNFYTVRRMPRH